MKTFKVELETSLGRVIALFTDSKINGIFFAGHEKILNSLERRGLGDEAPENSTLPDHLRTQLEEYSTQQRTEFDLPFHAHGTPFQKKVWESLLRIPYGETRSYAQVAASIGQPNAHRAVAQAIGKNPLLILIPCHRVRSSNGDVGGYSGGSENKKKLMALEVRA